MHECERITGLRRELRRYGIWGNRAHRLIEEWTEHAHDDTARRITEGASPETAEAEASRELHAASWLGRHPWLAGLVLPIFVYIGLLMLIFIFGYWLKDWAIDYSKDYINLMAVACWKHLFNWFPIVIAIVWLTRMAVKMAGGWKLLVISVITSAFCTTSFWLNVIPPSHGPGTGGISVYGHGILILVTKGIISIFGNDAINASIPWHFVWMDARMWFQLVVIVLCVILLRSGTVSLSPDSVMEGAALPRRNA